jgi:hypothetical protein
MVDFTKLKPARLPLPPIYVGSTWTHRLAWKYQADQAPIDLTGMQARMQIRENPKSETVLIDLSTENGGIAITPEAGLIDFLIDKAVTAAIKWDQAQYDVLMTLSNGHAFRLCEGLVVAKPGITR